MTFGEPVTDEAVSDGSHATQRHLQPSSHVVFSFISLWRTNMSNNDKICMPCQETGGFGRFSIPMDWVPPQAVSALSEAGRMFVIAGKSALAAGQVERATAILACACNVLTCIDEMASYAPALELLVVALAEAGQIGAADNLTLKVDELEVAGLACGQIARLRLQLARADAIAGETDRGLSRVHDARTLMLAAETKSCDAALDAVEASLLAQTIQAGSATTAETLARRALVVADSVGEPEAACEAWHVLGTLAWSHDLPNATECFRHVRFLAQKHVLPFWRLRAQLGLGTTEWLATGVTNRLFRVRNAAARGGFLPIVCSVNMTMALDLILRGKYEESVQLIDQCDALASPTGLTEIMRWVALARSVLAAHQCRRHDMEIALLEFRELGGGTSQLAPLSVSLAEAVCALLEEDHEGARATIDQATSRYLPTAGSWSSAIAESLQHFLDRTPGGHEWQRRSEPTLIGKRPLLSLPYFLFGEAAALGRRGRKSDALAVFARAVEVATPYGLLHHLGLRLVAEAAYESGWGSPAEWLRQAEEYFRDQPGIAVTLACRRLLRQTGVTVPQRRQDRRHIPQQFRTLGVTVREFEVLQMLASHTSNRSIAAELHISPRTVEKHVASLMVKTGQHSRGALSSLRTNSILPGCACNRSGATLSGGNITG